MEVKTCGGFIENEKGGLLALLTEEVGEFYALVFASGKGRRALAELDIAKAYALKRKEFLDDGAAIMFLEEFNGFGNGHVENVVYVFAFEGNVEYFTLESFAMTFVTFEHEVGHELHFNRYDSGTFAFLASPAFDIERKVLWGETELLGK